MYYYDEPSLCVTCVTRSYACVWVWDVLFRRSNNERSNSESENIHTRNCANVSCVCVCANVCMCKTAMTTTASAMVETSNVRRRFYSVYSGTGGPWPFISQHVHLCVRFGLMRVCAELCGACVGLCWCGSSHAIYNSHSYIPKYILYVCTMHVLS